MILPKAELTGGLLAASDGRVHGHHDRNRQPASRSGTRAIAESSPLETQPQGREC